MTRRHQEEPQGGQRVDSNGGTVGGQQVEGIMSEAKCGQQTGDIKYGGKNLYDEVGTLKTN